MERDDPASTTNNQLPGNDWYGQTTFPIDEFSQAYRHAHWTTFPIDDYSQINGHAQHPTFPIDDISQALGSDQNPIFPMDDLTFAIDDHSHANGSARIPVFAIDDNSQAKGHAKHPTFPIDDHSQANGHAKHPTFPIDDHSQANGHAKHPTFPMDDYSQANEWSAPSPAFTTDDYSQANGSARSPAFTIDDHMKRQKSPSEDAKKEMRKITKNIILLSITFLLNFNSYLGLVRLQSSLHRDDGMGVITQCLVHVTRIFACLLLPNIIISSLGHKWAISLSLIGYILWMAANGYAVWGTMVPASMIVGACSGILWTAQSSYITISATRYAKLANEHGGSASISRFFGIFFFVFQLSGITGALISSFVLREPQQNITEEALAFCGVNDCPFSNATNPHEEPPEQTTVWMLVGIYIGIGLCAMILVILFVDKLPRDAAVENLRKKKTHLLVATIKHLKNKKQLALIPITTHTGFSQAAFSAEFTKSYITCALGLWNVGLVVIAFAAVNSIVCLTSGKIAKYIGRIPICTVGFLVDMTVQTVLLTWMPNPDEEYLFYIIGALWGFKEAILQTQINALYGSTFPDAAEPAYANYRMLESIGFAIPFGYSFFLCTSVKLFILIGSLLLAASGYYLVEYWNITERKKQQESDRELLMDSNERY